MSRTVTAGSIMSAPAITVGRADTIRVAASTMREHGVGSVVVVEGDRPVGILTERDLVRLVSTGADQEAPVEAHMTADPDTISADEDAESVFRRFAEKSYRHLPVVADGRLAGVVSLRDVMTIARIERISHPGQIEAPSGLEGVIVAKTTIGDVRGTEGFYHYRQYDATELNVRRSLEDVWHLIYEGHLPTKKESEAFREEIAPYRYVPESVQDLLPSIARAGDHFVPLEALRTAISLVASALDFQPSLDIGPEELRRNALQVAAVTPTLIMALYRLHQGQDPIEPRPDYGYAQNYLYMLTGEEPDPQHAWAIERYLISTVDHGFNASTFTARVIASTGADLGAAIVGAIGAMSGPLHGGAPSRALDMLDAIGTPDRAESWIRDAVSGGKRIMGFGHRVYKTEDPRSRLLRDVAVQLGGPLVDFAIQVEQTVVDVLAELKPGRHLYANVEFYAGVVMNTCGLPRDIFTPTFVSSRTIGWCAHVMEQASDNRLIRPLAYYIGEEPPQPVPAADE